MVNDLVTKDIKLPESFVVDYLIETLPDSLKDYKNSIKHKRKQMSLEDVIINIRIGEQNKTRDKAERAKELSSKENVVEERPMPKFNRTKPNSSSKVQNPTLKRNVIALFMANVDTMQLNVATEKVLTKSNQRQIWHKQR